MNRLFFLGGTAIALIVLIATIFLTMGDIEVDESVEAGFVVWQTQGCESCHTLYGQGGNYAPDLTRIHTQRGDGYLRDFMVNPAAYHPDARVMPKFNLRQTEIEQLIAMLEWTASPDTIALTWPPNPIRVSGSAGLNINTAQDIEVAENIDPLIAQGQSIYSQRCASCHSIAEDVAVVGPSFWNIANNAATRVEGQDAEEYLRNSIINPSDFIVEGFQDLMQKNLGEVLSSQDINAVIAYLMTFDATAEPTEETEAE